MNNASTPHITITRGIASQSVSVAFEISALQLDNTYGAHGALLLELAPGLIITYHVPVGTLGATVRKQVLTAVNLFHAKTEPDSFQPPRFRLELLPMIVDGEIEWKAIGLVRA